MHNQLLILLKSIISYNQLLKICSKLEGWFADIHFFCCFCGNTEVLTATFYPFNFYSMYSLSFKSIIPHLSSASHLSLSCSYHFLSFCAFIPLFSPPTLEVCLCRTHKKILWHLCAIRHGDPRGMLFDLFPSFLSYLCFPGVNVLWAIKKTNKNKTMAETILSESL